jgi:hypothetical protein
MTNILTGRVSVTKRFLFHFNIHVTESMSFNVGKHKLGRV